MAYNAHASNIVRSHAFVYFHETIFLRSPLPLVISTICNIQHTFYTGLLEMEPEFGIRQPSSRGSLADLTNWYLGPTQIPRTLSLVSQAANSQNAESNAPLIPETSSLTVNQQSSVTDSSVASSLRQPGEKLHLDIQSGRKSPNLRSTVASWSLEIFAMIVSLGSMIAIGAVLSRENGRPLSAWSFMFSLNTIIATLGTLARTTLAFALSACIGQQKWNWLRRKSDSLVAFERFDEASRGPWGATRLFFWLRVR
jgi:hypothetical protein